MTGVRGEIRHAPYVRLAPRGTDIDALAALWTASWQAVMPSIDFAARRDWFCGYVTTLEAQGAETICAFDGARLLGFMLLNRQRGILEQIAVRPEFFGAGIGLRLVDAAKGLCPNGLALDVNADNPRALRFYEKAGFERRQAGVNPRSGLKTWRMHWLGPSGSL